jgi:spermidine/putrescine-binding protein
MMKRHSRVSILLFAACFFGALLCGPMNVCADESSTYNLSKGVHIDLNKEFYDALSDTNRTGGKVHTTDSSMVYMKLILKNQEEIIRKLDLLLEQKN